MRDERMDLDLILNPVSQDISNKNVGQGGASIGATTTQPSGNDVNDNPVHSNLAHNIPTASQDISVTDIHQSSAAVEDMNGVGTIFGTKSSNPIPGLSKVKLAANPPKVSPTPSSTPVDTQKIQSEDARRRSQVASSSRGSSERGSNGLGMAASGMDEEAGGSLNDTHTRVDGVGQATIDNDEAAMVACGKGECIMSRHGRHIERHRKACKGIYREILQDGTIACRFRSHAHCDWSDRHLPNVIEHETRCPAMGLRSSSSRNGPYPCRYCTKICHLLAARISHEKSHGWARDVPLEDRKESE